jgi:uncharacterized protein YjbJ (UPF0337 family)
MNWDRIEGKWKEFSGRVREQWGKLTDDDLQVIHGKREKLAGMLQQRYGIAKEEAEKQIAAFERSLNRAA